MYARVIFFRELSLSLERERELEEKYKKISCVKRLLS
jgi:hypothetical protein